MKKIKMNLRLQLGFIFAVLIAFSITIVSVFVINNEKDMLKKMLSKTGEQIAENIAGSTADALSQTPVDDTTIVYVLSNATKGENSSWIRYVRITDSEDSMILASNNVIDEWGKNYTAPDLEMDDIRPYFLEGTEKIYEITAKVKTSDGKIIGNIHLGFSQKYIDAIINKATGTVLLVAFILIIGGVFFSGGACQLPCYGTMGELRQHAPL